MSSEFFTSRPPAQRVRQTFPVKRSSKKHKLKFEVLCLSDRLTVAPTHHAGRTVPCVKPFGRSCPSCNRGHEPRYVGYFAAFDGHARCIVEVTAGAADLFAAEAQRRGSMRGLEITLSRMNDRPNGPLLIRWEPSSWPSESIPECFDVEEALFRMWRINEHIAKNNALAEDRPTAAGLVAMGAASESDYGNPKPPLTVTHDDGECPKCGDLMGDFNGVDVCTGCGWSESEVA